MQKKQTQNTSNQGYNVTIPVSPEEKKQSQFTVPIKQINNTLQFLIMSHKGKTYGGISIDDEGNLSLDGKKVNNINALETDQKIKIIQTIFKHELNLDDSFKIDGIWGPKTSRAYDNFKQQLVGIVEPILQEFIDTYNTERSIQFKEVLGKNIAYDILLKVAVQDLGLTKEQLESPDEYTSKLLRVIYWMAMGRGEYATHIAIRAFVQRCEEKGLEPTPENILRLMSDENEVVSLLKGQKIGDKRASEANARWLASGFKTIIGELPQRTEEEESVEPSFDYANYAQYLISSANEQQKSLESFKNLQNALSEYNSAQDAQKQEKLPALKKAVTEYVSAVSYSYNNELASIQDDKIKALNSFLNDQNNFNAIAEKLVSRLFAGQQIDHQIALYEAKNVIKDYVAFVRERGTLNAKPQNIDEIVQDISDYYNAKILFAVIASWEQIPIDQNEQDKAAVIKQYNDAVIANLIYLGFLKQERTIYVLTDKALGLLRANEKTKVEAFLNDYMTNNATQKLMEGTRPDRVIDILYKMVFSSSNQEQQPNPSPQPQAITTELPQQLFASLTSDKQEAFMGLYAAFLYGRKAYLPGNPEKTELTIGIDEVVSLFGCYEIERDENGNPKFSRGSFAHPLNMKGYPVLSEKGKNNRKIWRNYDFSQMVNFYNGLAIEQVRSALALGIIEEKEGKLAIKEPNRLTEQERQIIEGFLASFSKKDGIWVPKDENILKQKEKEWFLIPGSRPADILYKLAVNSLSGAPATTDKQTQPEKTEQIKADDFVSTTYATGLANLDNVLSNKLEDLKKEIDKIKSDYGLGNVDASTIIQNVVRYINDNKDILNSDIKDELNVDDISTVAKIFLLLYRPSISTQ